MNTSIVLASSNTGKLTEFSQLLMPLGLTLKLQSDFNISSAAETGLSFVENAILKARHACQHSGLPALADDSGLEVNALNGAPGIRSARFSSTGQDTDNNHALLAALSEVPKEKRQATFTCVLVYMRHATDASPGIFYGQWSGRILNAPIGDNGFGYDPVFYIEETQCSVAQLNSDEKNQRSHRAKAIAQFIHDWENIPLPSLHNKY